MQPLLHVAPFHCGCDHYNRDRGSNGGGSGTCLIGACTVRASPTGCQSGCTNTLTVTAAAAGSVQVSEHFRLQRQLLVAASISASGGPHFLGNGRRQCQ